MCQPLVQKSDSCTQKGPQFLKIKIIWQSNTTTSVNKLGFCCLPVADSNSPRLSCTLLIMTETPSLEKTGPTVSPHPLYAPAPPCHRAERWLIQWVNAALPQPASSSFLSSSLSPHTWAEHPSRSVSVLSTGVQGGDDTSAPGNSQHTVCGNSAQR